MKQSLLFTGVMAVIEAANSGFDQLAAYRREAEELVVNGVLAIVYGGLAVVTGERD